MTTRYGKLTDDPRSSPGRPNAAGTVLDPWYVTENATSETVNLSAEVTRLVDEVDGLRADMQSQPISWNSSIIDLGEAGYRILQPLPVLVQEYPGDGGVIARCPELEIFGDGSTSAEALANLKSAILDLYDELTECDIATLGDVPRTWLRILHQVVVRVTE